jgi:hypothetical protein
MTLLLSLIVGLVVWLVLWAVDVKSFDAFLITILIVLIAGTMRVVTPLVRKRGAGDEPGAEWTPR